MMSWVGLVWLGCTPPAADSAAPALPTVTDISVVVPDDRMPPEVLSQDAHNNLDIVEHQGRMFLAFRTAPSHFASADTVLYVVSTEDEQSWRFEGQFTMGTDLREPRFLSWDGRLWLYFAELGDNPADFAPKGTWVSEWLSPEQWTAPAPVYEDGFIPWRVHTINERPLIIGYIGGENIYDLNGEPLTIHLLTTADGTTLTPALDTGPIVDTAGGSESDFAVLDDGSIVMVQRDEAGSDTGWGSRICRSTPQDWSDLTCVGDPRKYDSPLIFQHGGRVWLIGRRNLTETGNYDLEMEGLSPSEQALQYQLDYWQHPKRCALWEVDPDALRVDFVLDLPSQGDTCFASALPHDDTSWLVYNYSSPIDGTDPSWLEGQNGETWIYRMILDFPYERDTP